MTGPSNNQPRPAVLDQGALPALPEWTKFDDLGGKVPSEIRTAFNAHAREAWTMGLDVGMAHAPAANETTLPDLARLLGTASKEGKAVKLSAIAAGTLYNAMTTAPAPAAQQAATPASETSPAPHVTLDEALASGELQQLKAEAQALAADGANWSMDVGCMFVLAMIERIEAAATEQLAGYLNPDDLPKLGQCRATLWATPQQANAVPVFMVAPSAGSAT